MNTMIKTTAAVLAVVANDFIISTLTMLQFVA